MNEQAEFDFEARREERKQASAAVLDRIKKLLRLAADKRGNVHEAERAMQLAFELAEKFHVDVENLDLDEAGAGLVREHFEIGPRFDQLRQGVCGILQTFFHVTVCLSRPQLIVIGKEHDVMIARYVFDFLLREGRACVRLYGYAEAAARRRMSTAKRTGYIAGFIYGIASKLKGAQEAMPLNDAQRALVVAEESARDAELEQVAPRRKDVKLLDGRKNKTSLEAGYRDGRATTINQPLAGPPAGAPLLLT